MKMKFSRKALLILFLILFIGLSGGAFYFLDNGEGYSASIIELGMGFTAKEFCSCLFVTEQSEGFCRKYAAIDQVSPRLNVDYETKTVSSSLLWWRREARFVAPEYGCRLTL